MSSRASKNNFEEQAYHSAIYFLGKLIPSFISLLSIYVFTRKLDFSNYGMISIVTPLIIFFNIILFQWLPISITRFYHSSNAIKLKLRNFSLDIFYKISCVVFVILFYFSIFLIPQNLKSVFLASATFLFGLAWYDLNIQYLQIKLQPIAYSFFDSLRSVIGFFSCILFLNLYETPTSILFGTAIGYILASNFIFFYLGKTSSSNITSKSKPTFYSLFKFGFPYALSLGSLHFANFITRIYLSFHYGSDIVGKFSPSFDLVQYVINMVMSSAAMAGLPILLKSISSNNISFTIKKLLTSLTLQILLGLPMLIAFIMLSNDLSSLFFQKDYHDISVKLIPLFAVTSFLIAIRVNYFDLVFQFTGHTYWIFFITLISIFLNILLFIYFFPLFGLEGLSYALLLSSLFALLASIIIGRSF